MKIKIDIYSKDPIYKQITDYIEKLVHDGQMPAGYQLPSMNELALGGLTTVSTDFTEMGRTAAGMILSRQLIQCHNPFRMTRRKTF